MNGTLNMTNQEVSQHRTYNISISRNNNGFNNSTNFYNSNAKSSTKKWWNILVHKGALFNAGTYPATLAGLKYLAGDRLYGTHYRDRKNFLRKKLKQINYIRNW